MKTLQILILTASLLTASAATKNNSFTTNSEANSPKTHWPGYSGYFSTGTNIVFPLGWNLLAPSPWGTSGAVLTNGNYRFFPWYSGNGGVITQLSVKVVTAPSGNIRFGIYDSISHNNWFPSNLVYDSGSAVASVATFTSNCTVTIRPGRMYWSVVHADAASAIGTPSGSTGAQCILGLPSLAAFSVAASSPISFEFQPGIFGALPNPFPQTNGPGNIVWQTATTYATILAARFQ